MEYSVQQLARLAGISARTLRYYDQTGLLKPARIAENGYRVYGGAEVDALQQILFYRELGVPLKEIGAILHAPDFDRVRALSGHLSALRQKKDRVERLIQAVTRTIEDLKGEREMNDAEKFEGFKQGLLDDNERAYGQEIRQAYGEAAVEKSNARLKGMSEADWQQAKSLSAAVNEGIQRAMVQGDPAGEAAQQACDLHRQWLCMYWPEGQYTKQAHLALAQMYCDDERFTAYYGAIAPGAAAFLLEAMKVYCAAEPA